MINKVSNKRSINTKTAAFVLTFLLGIIPFAILSIQTNSFWLNSKYDFPLLTLPSIWIGDTFLLPVFNYFAFDTIGHIKKLLQTKQVYSILLISILISLLINSYTHYLWIHDKYTGFMDTALGSLSVAGWWHFGFSVLQMMIVLSFAGIWFTLLNRANINTLIKFENTWKFFVAFTSISILDFFSKNLLVFQTSLSSLNFFHELSSYITLLSSGSVLIIMIILRHKKQFQNQKTA